MKENAMHTIKKILPAAILAAFAGAANAQVSVYGLVDMSYGKNEFIGDTNATMHSGGDGGNSEGNSTTRFGIKGSTEIAPGVKGNVKFESGGITSEGKVNDNGNGSFFNRQMWFGVSGALGEVRLGRQDSVPFQIMGNFDFNGQSNGVTSAYSGIGVWNTGRQSRSIQYISPEMSGFKAQLGYAARDTDTVTTTVNDIAVASAAAMFTGGNLAVGASYESKRAVGGEDFASVAASYDFSVVKVMAGYTDNGPALKGPSFGVTAPIAGFSVGAHYAMNSKGNKDAVTELFVNKEVFKNTYGYVEYAKMKSDAAASNGLKSYSAGVIYVF